MELQTPAESSATESATVENINAKDAVTDQVSQEPVEATQQTSPPLENPPEPSLLETATNIELEAVVQNGIQVTKLNYHSYLHYDLYLIFCLF